MCGVAGLFYFRGPGVVDPAVLATMRDAMVHRGPDGGDLWVSPTCRVGLAHRRLSIVDLSQSASQPMRNEDGNVWVSFNGEIYNHLRLRAELLEGGHRFRTDHSDTEVLLHGFEQWGIEGLLQRIEGDYAFAIWDTSTESLCLARDRIGVKPLYFSFQGGLLLFASEIKAILKHPVVECDIDPLAMYHYLSFLATPSPMTMFKGVNKLPPAHYLRIRSGGTVEAVRYWDAVPGQSMADRDTKGYSDRAREDFYVTGIRSRLVAAVEKRMMSDVPLGVFLSGGIDSSTNVALMGRYTERPIDTFTVGFKKHERLNEIDHARLVAQRFKTNHHEVLVDEDDMFGYLDDLMFHQDEPIADYVCIPLYFVSKLAKDSGVAVVQVGEGADELFAGYSSYLEFLKAATRWWDPFRRWVPKSVHPLLSAAATQMVRIRPKLAAKADMLQRAMNDGEMFWSGATVLWESMKRDLVNVENLSNPGYAPELISSGLLPARLVEADSSHLVESWLGPFDRMHPECDVLRRMVYCEFQLRLPELLLMRVDKITMSVSMEARVPFLDHQLVEFSMDIPQEWQVRNGESKYLLRKAVKDLVPDEVMRRPKMGFSAPMAEWIKGPFGQHVEAKLAASDLISRGFLNWDGIATMLDRHRRGKQDLSVHIWALYNLAAWYDRWIH